MSELQKRILVVDDEENTRLALTRLLAREGYDVKTAANGSEALSQIRNQPVELIITDLNMPVMNGLTFLRELNREQPASNVIMITAYGEVESYLEALNLGAFEYLNKPVKLDELKKLMHKMFHKSP
ncbi:MAG: response regulator [Trichlorobacter sp.]